MKKTGLPLLLRLTNSKIHPLLLGLLVSITLTLIHTIILSTEGYQMTFELFWDSSYVILTSGYVVFISRVIYNSHFRQLKTILNSAQVPEQNVESFEFELKNPPWLWAETAVAVIVGSFHGYWNAFQYVIAGTSPNPTYATWMGLQIILIWLLITHATAISVRNMRILNRASKHIEVNILKPEQFMPLTSAGIISILAFIGAYSLLFVQAYPNITFNNPAMLALAPSIFWLLTTPLKGVRKRFANAKNEELDLIDRAIEGDEAALKKSRVGQHWQNINLVDMIHYKKIVQNTLEIPINLPTASRFFFYLIIPLLTWIASSIVDKTIDFLI